MKTQPTKTKSKVKTEAWRKFPVFEFRNSIDGATNSSLAHLSFVSDCLRTAQAKRR
jgi:hypothetical protein